MSEWVACGGAGLRCPEKGIALAGRAETLCVCDGKIWCAGGDRARLIDPRTGEVLRACAFPPAVCGMVCARGALYALSADADSLSRFCPLTGRLLLCAPAGCYPRDLKLSPCGRMLLVAAGASGQAVVYERDSLRAVLRVPLPGIVVSACFYRGGLAALCAAGDEEIVSLLYIISPRGVREEALRLRGLPGALRDLPDGSLLVGSLGGLIRQIPGGRALWRFPCGLPARVRIRGSRALITDTLDGRILSLPLHDPLAAKCLCEGAEMCDAEEV